MVILSVAVEHVMMLVLHHDQCSQTVAEYYTGMEQISKMGDQMRTV